MQRTGEGGGMVQLVCGMPRNMYRAANECVRVCASVFVAACV